MDVPFFRVPLEEANGYFRLRQKAVERTLSSVTACVDALPAPASAEAEIEAAIQALEQLRTNVSTWTLHEQRALGRVSSRNSSMIAHRGEAELDPSIACVEHLYRRGCIPAAHALFKSIRRGGDFVDVDACCAIHAAADALRSRDLNPALQWVHGNASRLRRSGSHLDFNLRKQQFIELIRARDMAAALEHATSHLAPAATAAGEVGEGEGTNACVRQLQAVMSLLAFPDPPRCGIPELERLFAPVVYEALAEAFVKDAEEALGWPAHTRLEVACAAGLTALRTPSCVAEHGVGVAGARAGVHACDGVARLHAGGGAQPAPAAAAAASGSIPTVSLTCSSTSVAPVTVATLPLPLAVDAANTGRTVMLPPSSGHTCPVCHPLYFSQAQQHVPLCRRGVSRLLCSVTREPMNDGNPPCVLPNGHVFAARTLELLTSEGEGAGGRVMDPTSGEVFPKSAVRKAFIL